MAEDLKERIKQKYNMNEKLSINTKTQILNLQVQDKIQDKINIIWPNQNKCGEAICNVFTNLAIVSCLVYGMTQTGKTGCMTALILHYALENLIPIDNIYIITGLSDKAWKNDTKNRMPDILSKRVFHRGNLKQFEKDIKNKKNVLIIMDEIQIACEEDQSIFKIFNKCGFYDLNFLLENDIKIVQFSATPDGHINDIADWEIHSDSVKLEPGNGYYGVYQAISQKRVRQFKNLMILSNVEELKPIIDSLSIPKYHQIRVPNKRANKQETVISNFKKIFGNSCDYNIDYLKQKKDDINDLITKEPIKNTIIFICEILRCAKTQCKKHIGISYERYVSSPNDSSIIQGSFGRLTGYDDNNESICYTNVSSLENYIKLWDNDMKFKTGIEWDTKTSKYDSASSVTHSTGTYNSTKHIEQLKDNCSEKTKSPRGNWYIKKFIGENSQKEMKQWFNTYLKNSINEYLSKNTADTDTENKKKKVNGPRTKEKDNGFYKGSITQKSGNKGGPEILSTSTLSSRDWTFVTKSIFRSYPCYSDTNKSDTLEWWLIWDKKYYDPETLP